MRTDPAGLPERSPLWLAALAVLGAIAWSQQAQAQAGSALLGVGTPGVTTHMPGKDAPSLQAMLDHCHGVPPPRPGEAAASLARACDQLRRQLNNQPTSTLSAGAVK